MLYFSVLFLRDSFPPELLDPPTGSFLFPCLLLQTVDIDVVVAHGQLPQVASSSQFKFKGIPKSNTQLKATTRGSGTCICYLCTNVLATKMI